MSYPTPTLHLMCGKIGSGKSSLARLLGESPVTIVLSEDSWLATLYGDDMSSIGDYVRNAARLRDAMHQHVVTLLGAGVSVVLDFPANTIDSRAWLRSLVDETGVHHVLHYLDVPDAVCKARLRKRNASGAHAFDVSDAQFDQITGYFVPPAEDERFNVVLHRNDEVAVKRT
ncbi:AAA family ATPase [Phaeobacter marinintestinus]|uniref:AAA family ATPase n=1 Tax=Falsiphaeobacter marinintestinus TaxID=1492905 RepID=UPI0011B3F631|nr:ATP-binding protein [Phaeobacter marinintestinus]